MSCKKEIRDDNKFYILDPYDCCNKCFDYYKTDFFNKLFGKDTCCVCMKDTYFKTYCKHGYGIRVNHSLCPVCFIKLNDDGYCKCPLCRQSVYSLEIDNDSTIDYLLYNDDCRYIQYMIILKLDQLLLENDKPKIIDYIINISRKHNCLRELYGKFNNKYIIDKNGAYIDI